jgi:SAM-dependent methyltransferase
MNEAAISIEKHDTHPSDAIRWGRARENAVLRGRLVCELLAPDVDFTGSVALDAGCGYGGTSIALCERGADVIAVDRDPARLGELARLCPSVEIENADLTSLPYPDASFHLIILQDVIEHVANATDVLQELHRVLRNDGLLYMSTPNRDSVINYFSDPHFGLPFAATKDRAELRLLLRRKRPSEAERDDLAELLSLDALSTLLKQNGFAFRFVNTRAARALFEKPTALVWNSWHLRAVELLRHSGLYRAALTLVNDDRGFFNRRINPTWYLICRKLRS